LVAAELSGRRTMEHGIAVHAILPVAITEPADRAKNIVGKFQEFENALKKQKNHKSFHLNYPNFLYKSNRI
jgi:hypothetical protein